jgi:hypothetical protein
MRHGSWRWSLALSVVFVGVMVGPGASSAQGAVVAYFSGNGFDPSVSTVLNADIGSGTLNVSSFGTGATVFAGTTLNAPVGTPAGDSIGLTNSANNGAFARIDVSTAGMTDLSLSFAVRRSGTGFSDNAVQALIGGSWVTVANFNPSTTAWGMVTVDLSALDALENGFASLRLLFDGATSGSGTVRFDNLLLEGSAIPAPGALALLGTAGLLGGRRRSRR